MKAKPLNDNKRIVTIISVIAVIIIGIIFISNTYSIKEENPSDIVITNEKVKTENGTTKIIAEVENETGSDYKLKYIEVTITDEGQEIKLPAYIGEEIKDNTSKILDVTYDKEIDNTNVSFEIKK